ncbi:MAG: hypothetical protein J1F42_11695 [Lachnospiraceae bacterium]|nr:hypothetical protein [Lachnospiraceae bacterium]
MDKYEYKVRADEIKALISEGEFAEAVSIADTIDWRRVKSVMMLCTISDLYKINRRYQESKDILLLAYEKHPTGRLIVYSLCELSIKMEEYVQAIEYYKEFVQIAPKDTGRYILQYRLYEAQDVSLEERIAVLEEFKKRDYREKWAYELAYLYHRIGLTTKCVEECDEMFLWFGDGKYVIKALELKMLHGPLSDEQQVRYDAWVKAREAGEEPSEDEDVEESRPDDVSGDTRVVGQVQHTEDDTNAQEVPAVPTMELPEVKTVDVGQYNTINLQMALAESMKEILEEDVPQEISENEEAVEEAENKEIENDVEDTDNNIEDTESDDEEQDSLAVSLIAPLLEETVKLPDPEEVEEQIRDSSIVQFPERAAVEAQPTEEEEAEPEEDVAEEQDDTPVDEQPENAKIMSMDELQEVGFQLAQEDTASFDAQQIVEQMKQEAQQAIATGSDVLTPLNAKPSKYDNFLSQEYDGQISLVVPEESRVEKQITGQLSIDDIMAEWEEMKKTSQERRMEEVRQRILAHTGNLFADFDEATKNGLLEELERAFVAAIMKDTDQKPTIKKVILPDDDDTINSALDVVKSEAEQLAASVTSKIELSQEDLDDGVEELEEIEESVVEENAVEISTPEQQPTAAASVEESVAQEVEAEEDGGQKNIQERELTAEEQELFGQFAHHRRSKKQLVHTLDNMSLASCTGNVIITGDEEITTLTLAKALIKEMQLNDNNFSGKVAKISANVLNRKDVAETFDRLDNGALIIEKASRLKPLTVALMIKNLEKDNKGLLLIMIDKKKNINQLLADNSTLNNNFNLRVDIEPLNDEALVAYAKQYAEEMEYSIDEFGILALHTRIADRQTSDHEVSMAEVRELVDEAIHYANKKTPKHFMDILLAKRYDEEDMIILREKDFMHY